MLIPKNRRLFIAFQISPELTAQIQIWRGEQKIQFPLRWAPPENYHVTLIPPFYDVSADEAIKKVRAAVAGCQTFSVSFDRVRVGPGARQPRLIWAEGNTPQPLLNLKAALDLQFIPKETRAFRLHLTLARFKRDERNVAFESSVNWTDHVGNVSLLESVLSKEGAVHHVIEKISF